MLVKRDPLSIRPGPLDVLALILAQLRGLGVLQLGFICTSLLDIINDIPK